MGKHGKAGSRAERHRTGGQLPAGPGQLLYCAIIEANQKAATLAAYVDVMPTVSDAKTLEEVTGYTTENVTGVVKAEDGSIAIK